MAAAGEHQKKKKPPTFKHYPEQRAKSLKKTWVETAKIKSQWKAERRKMGLPSRSLSVADDQAPAEEEDEKTKSDMDEQTAPEPQLQSDESAPRDIRELARKAYSRETLHTYKSDPLNRGAGSRGNGRGRGTRGRGQPNMKLRMGVMLEKIKRNFT